MVWGQVHQRGRRERRGVKRRRLKSTVCDEFQDFLSVSQSGLETSLVLERRISRARTTRRKRPAALSPDPLSRSSKTSRRLKHSPLEILLRVNTCWGQVRAAVPGSLPVFERQPSGDRGVAGRGYVGGEQRFGRPLLRGEQAGLVGGLAVRRKPLRPAQLSRRARQVRRVVRRAAGTLQLVVRGPRGRQTAE